MQRASLRRRRLSQGPTGYDENERLKLSDYSCTLLWGEPSFFMKKELPPSILSAREELGGLPLQSRLEGALTWYERYPAAGGMIALVETIHVPPAAGCLYDASWAGFKPAPTRWVYAFITIRGVAARPCHYCRSAFQARFQNVISYGVFSVKR